MMNKEQKYNIGILDVPRDLIVQAINFFGHREQRGMMVEEMGELMVAMNKYERYHTPTQLDNIAEEIADVYIMLAQMRVSYDIQDGDIEFYIDEKLNKLAKYVKEDARNPIPETL